MIREAAEFATRAHEGTYRKGSDMPYIYHPMEVALIVACMTGDEEVIAAAYLHDVLEDTGVTPQELERLFGVRVLALVTEETEDKRNSWKERKQATIDHMECASREVKILALGDKLSNMRSTARDYMVVGDEVWQRFREKDKSWHRWYVCGMLESLSELSGCPAYKELKELYEFVFGA